MKIRNARQVEVTYEAGKNYCPFSSARYYQDSTCIVMGVFPSSCATYDKCQLLFLSTLYLTACRSDSSDSSHSASRSPSPSIEIISGFSTGSGAALKSTALPSSAGAAGVSSSSRRHGEAKSWSVIALCVRACADGCLL